MAHDYRNRAPRSSQCLVKSQLGLPFPLLSQARFKGLCPAPSILYYLQAQLAGSFSLGGCRQGPLW